MNPEFVSFILYNKTHKETFKVYEVLQISCFIIKTASKRHPEKKYSHTCLKHVHMFTI